MQPFNLLRQLQQDVIDYVSSKYPFLEHGREDLDTQLRRIMGREGSIFQDPVLQLVRSRSKGSVDTKIFHPLLQETIKALPELSAPYSHQVRAWENISQGTPTVVSTGTGSGKSESFIIPVIDGLLKKGYGPTQRGIGAVFIYPMNALVHDQFLRIFKYAAGTGIRVGIYNGAFKELNTSDRKKICSELAKIFDDLKKDRPHLKVDESYFDPNLLVVDPQKPETIPHILLTNYKMLEYMLLRSTDQPLFKNMDLHYLALDEAHTFSGTLALEIACLLTRLKVHLGSRGSHFLPIATSATLSQGASGDVTDEMRIFFSKLFGHEFPRDKKWLLHDEFEPLPEANVALFAKWKSILPDTVEQHLTETFPENLIALAKLFFGIEATSVKTLPSALHESCVSIGPYLAAAILRDESGEVEASVSWTEACQRFEKRIGLSRGHLEALLVLCSHAFKNRNFPALGLRIHVFGRSEPRIYWSLDETTLYDTSDRETAAVPALNFVSCRKCGHGAWAALAKRSGESAEEVFRLDPLPEFFDEEQLATGTEAWVLHQPRLVEAGSQKWKFDDYFISTIRENPLARPCGRFQAGPNEMRLTRVVRTTSKKEIASDFHSCPACGSTSGEDRRPVMITHRGGASTDLSVYGASVLTHTIDDGDPKNDNKERKLLIFCDNRQETSFLSGFLTDRHRRLNLRRAIASYLFEAEKAGDNIPWPLFVKDVGTKRSDDACRFDFAARLLVSLETGKFFGRQSALPKSFPIRKLTVQNLIPREVLISDWIDRRNNESERERSLKGWLLENYSIDETKDQERKQDQAFDLFTDGEKSRWILQLLSDVILLDISSVQVREGSLHSLGLVTWNIKGVHQNIFNEWALLNSDLGLKADGLFQVAYWFLEQLADNGQWTGINLSTARHYLGRYSGRNPQSSLGDLLGSNFDDAKGISKNSQIGRLLELLGGEVARVTWSKKATWDRLIKQSPLKQFVFYSRNDQDVPKIEVDGILELTPKVQTYRSKTTGARRVVPIEINCDKCYSGKRDNDVWEKQPNLLHDYYSTLYRQPLATDARLIRAQEHNGMLSSADANEAVRRFRENEINTLVATPTLEMGVDLPDLPTVIHRSVPPDPSNYAQRAGRAGRGPKRALLLTHCGVGSHDMTFFESPRDMVGGEILPPGIPVENTFIITRHINGLILEAMSLSSESSEALDLRRWNSLVDVSKFVEEYKQAGGDGVIPPAQIQDWKNIFEARRDLIESFIEDFIKLISKNLWFDLESEGLRASLEQDVRQKSNSNNWIRDFERQLNSFTNLLKVYLGELRKLRHVDMALPQDEVTRIQRARARAKKLTEIYLGYGAPRDLPTPLSDMASTGFLPNFDFPGLTTRFRGVKDLDARSTQKDSQVLRYDRSARVALREFAPEQKIYGHGFIYQVDRYIASDLSPHQGERWGVCSVGCTTLLRPGVSVCGCGAEVIKSGDASNLQQPELIEVREVHGSQAEVISDKTSRRELSYFTEEVKRIGTPKPDHRLEHFENPAVQIDFHFTPSSYIHTARLVMNKDGGNGQDLAGRALYREISDGSSFGVKLRRPAENVQNWKPFIPCVHNEGQGIILHLPFREVHAQGWIGIGEPEYFLHYFRTLDALLDRSIQKVLRLNRRNNHLDIAEHRLMRATAVSGEATIQELSLMLLDSEPGGSGVIPMIKTYWNQIMDECERLVRKDCCINGCYRCIKSFENQFDHHLLMKSMFSIEGKAPLFGLLRNLSQNWKETDIHQTREADKRSPPEEALKKFLEEKFPNIGFKTQSDYLNRGGHTITISDFEISLGSRKAHLFVDGWEFHSGEKAFLSDIEKRNALAKGGWPVFWIPGHWPVNSTHLETVGFFLKDADANTALRVSQMALSRLPARIDEQSMKHLADQLSDTRAFMVLDLLTQIPELSRMPDVRIGTLLKALDKLAPTMYPLAQKGNDLLLCMVNGSEIMADKEIWDSWCLMQSSLASLGYRVLNVWVGKRSA